MTKIIDATNYPLGRLASLAAKEALKGEEIIIVNCSKAIVTGGKESIKREFEIEKARVGTLQVGPKISKTSYEIVKRAIRGMLPNHRFGRGREAFKKIKGYNETPKEYESAKKITFVKDNKKFVEIKYLSRLGK
jgi:ribosomal protein uL13